MADSPNADDSREGKRESIFEVLDELIFHMNTTKNIFTLLIVSSFILAPAALILAAVLIGHPRFMQVLMNRLPEVGMVILVYSVVSIILSSLWLFIGIKEHRFFSRWNNRFRRFMSLRDQIDRELGEEEDKE